ncbi:heterodimeric geranylgeranyl pyrophosphate synthase small subunit, chloroplastic-like [Aristolochia californica]|uniref:heterodimeric geranylgeranyl pyrophosphate synthase small subunit, chloroplastic-like n=1 Tax=Aristolochia californica TaxID=171875 RepID=UPI0035E2C983
MAATSLHFAGIPTLRRRFPRCIPLRLSTSCKVISGVFFTTSEKQSYWSGINADVEAYLERSFPLREPLVVHQPIHDLVLSAPRTMAPALCVVASDLVGRAERDHSVAIASALHVMHAASQAHEYLPQLIERHTPTAYERNIEILCGDAIYPFGYELVAGSIGGDPVRATRVMVEMARSMGAQGYLLGQYKHARWTKGEGGVREVCEKKEGELYSCAAVCGAIVGGADEDDEERLRRFGFYVGMIYGMLFGSGRDVINGREEAVRSFRSSALKELEGFQSEKVGYISSLLDVSEG